MRSLPCCIRNCVLACIAAAVLLAASKTSLAAEATYLSFAVPGALGTFPTGLNDTMVVTGYYTTSSSSAAGFVRDAAGNLTLFNLPGALWTQPEGINAAGDVTGFYEQVAGEPQGFLRYADGRVVTFDPPSPGPSGPQAQPVAINVYDEVAGNFPFPAAASSGFTRSRTGTFSTLFYSQGAGDPTVVTGLNASGSVTGYIGGVNAAQAFIAHPDGYEQSFSVPLSGTPSLQLTIAQAINDSGTVAGWYFACSTQCKTVSSGGFVRSAQGVFTLFTPPGTLVPPNTAQVFSGTQAAITATNTLFLNASGVIAGSYTDTQQKQHGFLRNPYGTITTFDPPSGQQTTVTGVNTSGAITGHYYYNWNTQTAQAFIRLPE